jgi:hypothetical protein
MWIRLAVEKLFFLPSRSVPLLLCLLLATAFVLLRFQFVSLFFYFYFLTMGGLDRWFMIGVGGGFWRLII